MAQLQGVTGGGRRLPASAWGSRLWESGSGRHEAESRRHGARQAARLGIQAATMDRGRLRCLGSGGRPRCCPCRGVSPGEHLGPATPEPSQGKLRSPSPGGAGHATVTIERQDSGSTPVGGHSRRALRRGEPWSGCPSPEVSTVRSFLSARCIAGCTVRRQCRSRRTRAARRNSRQPASSPGCGP